MGVTVALPGWHVNTVGLAPEAWDEFLVVVNSLSRIFFGGPTQTTDEATGGNGMNPYLRAVKKHPKVKTQAKERLGKRKLGKPDKPAKSPKAKP